VPVSYRTSYAIHRTSGEGDSPAVARWRHGRLHGTGLEYVDRENQGTLRAERSERSQEKIESAKTRLHG
jgi:hypothetical protein